MLFSYVMENDKVEPSDDKNINSETENISDDQTSKSSRRPLRATMSLAEIQKNEDNAAACNRAHKSVPTPEEFVLKFGGKRVIKKILIANNGIAGKIVNFSSC